MRHGFSVSLFALISMSSATTVAVAAPAGEAPQREGRELPASVLFAKLAPSVVTIEAKLPDGTSQGSGVVVGKGLVVTNYHVIKGNTVLTVRSGAKTLTATVRSFDVKRDLALLQVVDLLAPRVSFRVSTDVKVGERTLAIGAPRGFDLTLSDGLISGKRPDTKNGKDTGVFLLQTSAPVSPGSSGGGLFDQRGRLLGVTTFSANGQNLNFAHPTEWIVELIGGATKGEKEGNAPAPKFSLTTRPEALRCSLRNTTLWGLFSAGPEMLENKLVSGTWDFDGVATQTPRALTVPRFMVHDEPLVLSDVNRDMSLVRFSPQSQTLQAEYFFFVDEGGAFHMAVLQPVHFHGQTRAQVTFGDCEDLTSQTLTKRRNESPINPYSPYSPYSGNIGAMVPPTTGEKGYSPYGN